MRCAVDELESSRFRARQAAGVASLTGEASLEVGGASRDRTDDPLVANQVLSQLSYSPPENGGPG